MLCDLHRLPYCTHACYNGVCKGSPLFRPMPYGSPTHSLDYTQKSTRSTLALKLSAAPPIYPWVTATEGVYVKFAREKGGLQKKILNLSQFRPIALLPILNEHSHCTRFGLKLVTALYGHTLIMSKRHTGIWANIWEKVPNVLGTLRFYCATKLQVLGPLLNQTCP